MKYVLPLLVAVVCALAACKTTSDRRDLYSPNKPQGPATAQLRDWTLFGHNNHKSTTYTYAISTGGGSPAATGPIAPPPPAPADGAMPDTNVGAPQATPMPGSAPVVPHAPKYTPQSAAPAPAGGASGGGIPMATPTDAGGGGGSDSGGGSSIPGLSQ